MSGPFETEIVPDHCLMVTKVKMNFVCIGVPKFRYLISIKVQLAKYDIKVYNDYSVPVYRYYWIGYYLI
jgi:hypothetical protein